MFPPRSLIAAGVSTRADRLFRLHEPRLPWRRRDRRARFRGAHGTVKSQMEQDGEDGRSFFLGGGLYIDGLAMLGYWKSSEGGVWTSCIAKEEPRMLQIWMLSFHVVVSIGGLMQIIISCRVPFANSQLLQGDHWH